jgi:peptide/nickel transport system substrate-binding protein
MGYESDPYQVWHSSQTAEGSNFVGFENAEVDQLIEEARREFDAEKRHALFHRIHRIIHTEQPYTFLFSSPALLARDRRFGNVNIYRGGIDVLEWTVTGN